MLNRTSHPTERPYDLFISYKSEDIDWVRKLKQSLETRGVRVWLDIDQIGPGRHFAECLERGIEQSKAMGLIISTASMASNWVREEYYCAFSLVVENKLNLIPILIEKTYVPGFMHERSYIDFTDEGTYDKNVDRVVWPGITGRRIKIAWVLPRSSHYCNAHHDTTLGRLVKELGVSRIDVELGSKLRYWWHGADEGRLYRGPRHIVLVNVFEDDQKAADRLNSPKDIVNFIFSLRKLTAQTDDELVFVLYHKAGSLQRCQTIKPSALERLSHYFTIEYDRPEEGVAQQFRLVWHAAQKLLMSTELYIPHVDTVCLNDVSVYELYNECKHIRKMNIYFSANYIFRNEDVSIYYEFPNVIVQISGGSSRCAPRAIAIADGPSIRRDGVFDIMARENEFILIPTGHNGVALDYKARMHVQTFLNDTFPYSRIHVRIEFIK